MVKRITFKMVRNPYLAQELMQEAFLQAYLSLERLRDDTRFESWLYGITLNVCRGYLRQRKMDILSLESLMGGMRVDPEFLTADAPDPETVVERLELHRLVVEAVNGLTPRNRDATMLYYYEQLTVGEIAALLNISISAVKARLRRSRHQLKRKLLSLLPTVDYVVGYQSLQTQIPQVQSLKAQERRSEMIQVSVADVVNGKWAGEDYYVAVLLDEASKRLLLIWVGPIEGWSMALSLRDFSMPRPMTFAFISKLLEASDAELEMVSISALKDTTFYATVTLKVDGTLREIDARPSDAINLALCMGRPIYVAESVMAEAGTDISDQETLPQGLGLEQLQQDWDERTQRIEEFRRSMEELTDEERNAKWVESQEKLMSVILGEET
jgi:RNA polymerase sigma factor (sigma-70 family)